MSGGWKCLFGTAGGGEDMGLHPASDRGRNPVEEEEEGALQQPETPGKEPCDTAEEPV